MTTSGHPAHRREHDSPAHVSTTGAAGSLAAATAAAGPSPTGRLLRVLERVASRTTIPFRVVLANGDEYRSHDGTLAFSVVFRNAHARRRVLWFRHVGLLEAYFDGDIDIEGDLQLAFRAAFDAAFSDQVAPLVRVRNWWHELRFSNRTHAQARINARAHYGLPYDFYRLWLDREAMMYTCAYWKEGTATVEQAQRNKMDHVCRKVQLAPGETFVDVGSGWGGLLFHAYERFGALGTGVNCTTEQNEWTRREIERRGLSDRLKVVDADFRDSVGQFDKMLSIGTLEHAGRDQLDEVIAAHAKLLKPGGLGVIHFIGHVGVFDTEFFIRRHIFPGGWIPSLAQALSSMERHGLEVIDVENLRRHYALTLDAWASRFDAHWPQIQALDPELFDEHFRRAWRTYLWACAEMFRSPNGRTHLFQVLVCQGEPRTQLSDESRVPVWGRRQGDRTMTAAAHEAKRAALQAAIAALPARGPRWIGQTKPTSNLFRETARRAPARVDVGGFDQVIAVDPSAQTLTVEGMTTYAAAVDACLPHGVMPAVVPQLRSITVGGAIAGVGIEATSFRHGLVHHTMRTLDVLTGDGRIVTCTPGNEHRDLYFGFPNSYGTLGYVIRASVATLPVKRFVHVVHTHVEDRDECFARLAQACADPGVDFVDGVVFGPDEHYVSCGTFVDDAPAASDYTFEQIYYRSLRTKREDWLTANDYLWRWDTDWFWCSKHVLADRPLVRRLLGRKRLNSITYQKIMRWNTRWGFTRLLRKASGVHAESVIQDVDIPIERASEFLAFMHREIGILPIWLCPIVAPATPQPFTLYAVPSGRLYVNFGFWDVVTRREPHEAGHFNRLLEQKVSDLGGIKSLYSDAYYPEDEFWRHYGREPYRALKARYDPEGTLGDLYDKCVRRHATAR